MEEKKKYIILGIGREESKERLERKTGNQENMESWRPREAYNIRCCGALFKIRKYEDQMVFT